MQNSGHFLWVRAICFDTYFGGYSGPFLGLGQSFLHTLAVIMALFYGFWVMFCDLLWG